MGLPRYNITDPYTLEELKREYQSSDAKGRIRLLKKLHGAAPYEIALLAVEDPSAQVRQWMARNSTRLDYRNSHYIDDQLACEYPDRNLEGHLKDDPDPFVRACLRENPTAFSEILADTWYNHFREASQLERLALLRNPEVHIDLIESIFDHQDTTLGVTFEQRTELVLAVLTNDGVVQKSHKQKYKGLDTEHFSQLWRLVSKWPESIRVQYLVYRFLGAEDKTKAEIYQTCDKPLLCRAILENCDGNDTKTIMLGGRDSDEQCRDMALKAVKKGNEITDHSLKAFLKSRDTDVLSQLASNKSLRVFELLKVRDRLYKLGDKAGAQVVEETIVRKQNAPLASSQRRGFRGMIQVAPWDDQKAVLLSIALVGGVYWFGSFQDAVLIALVIVVARAFMKS